jgi:hypothetical protein
MKKIIFSMIAVFVIGGNLYSQFTEDALRLHQTNGTYGARAGGLGFSYIGVSDDISSLIYNPAGLSLIPKSEFSFGFGFDSKTASSLLNSAATDLKSSDAYISNIGFSSPFKTRGGNGAIAIAYNLESNFNNNFETNYFNPNNTFTNYIATKGPQNVKTDNLAYVLWLTDNNLYTPIKDSLYQNNFIKESGGIHSISGGCGYDLNEFFSIGFTLSAKFGSYNYYKEFYEMDTKNKYNSFDSINYTNIDFNRLTVNENIKQSFVGISGIFGIQARISNLLRMGAAIKLPTLYSVDETYSQTAKALFDDGKSPEPPFESDGSNSYRVYSPFVFSGGASMHFAGLTVALGVEYSDPSQLEFSDGPPELNTVNREIIKTLTGQTSYGIGAEYENPLLPVVLRASYNVKSSVYANETSSQNIINLGAGVYLAPNIRLDALARFTETSEIRNYYDNEFIKLKNNPLNLQIQLTYRF